MSMVLKKCYAKHLVLYILLYVYNLTGCENLRDERLLFEVDFAMSTEHYGETVHLQHGSER